MSLPVHIVSVHLPVSLIDDSTYTVLDFPACHASGRIVSAKHFNLCSIWFNIQWIWQKWEKMFLVHTQSLLSNSLALVWACLAPLYALTLKSIPLMESLMTCFPILLLLRNVTKMLKCHNQLGYEKKIWLTLPVCAFPNSNRYTVHLLLNLHRPCSELRSLLRTFTLLIVFLNNCRSSWSYLTQFDSVLRHVSVPAHLANQWMWVKVCKSGFEAHFAQNPYSHKTWLLLLCPLALPLPPCAY